MEVAETQILIIGGGLTGLTLAHLLNNQGIREKASTPQCLAKKLGS